MNGSLIDKPDDLLKVINKCLKPKDIEKKKFGEVFTPLEFINDKMLKDLEDHYYNKYQQNIYENKNLKWFDPAVGMGNYLIAVYYKLMGGLKNMSILDTIEVKIKIVENIDALWPQAMIETIEALENGKLCQYTCPGQIFLLKLKRYSRV